MITTDVNILVWDKADNFHKPDTQRHYGNGVLYKKVYQFNSLETFEEALNKLEDNELVVVCCHINYENFSGFQEFKYSQIEQKYNISKVVYLSSAPSGVAMKDLHEKYFESIPIILYNQLQKNIKLDEIKPDAVFTIRSKPGLTEPFGRQNAVGNAVDTFEYALITALYDDEFEEIEKFFEFPEEAKVLTARREFHKGYLRTNRDIKIIAAIAANTGMVDAAIVATQMLELYKPKYLFMTGVCGGEASMAIGDIVVGTQFFMFQKGKVSDLLIKVGDQKVPAQISDRQGNPVDIEALVDQNGHHVSVVLEKFEIEHDSMIDMDALIKEKFTRKRPYLQEKMNEIIATYRPPVTIHMSPIACSTMVINKTGYFQDNIKSVNRKAAAVEMESYAVARACIYANNGNTKPIIIKSVMDNTVEKDDRAKKLASNTSAMLLSLLLESGILK